MVQCCFGKNSSWFFPGWKINILGRNFQGDFYCDNNRIHIQEILQFKKSINNIQIIKLNLNHKKQNEKK